MLSLTLSGKLPAGFSLVQAKRCVAAALTVAAYPVNHANLSVRIVTDAAMIKLNAAYRGKKSTTDVLSFPSREVHIPLPKSAQMEAGLGDIVISLPQVKRQAKAIGRAVSAELSLMLVHGTLHLLGYDHVTEKEERVMFGLQHDALIMAEVF